MPQTASLHIQADESGPVRVVELHAGPVRIGRAAFCDVRLPEPDLADEVCRLRRRGGAWQLVPVGPAGPVTLDGQPVGEPLTVGFDESFRVGTHTVTLRAPSDDLPESEFWSAPRGSQRASYTSPTTLDAVPAPPIPVGTPAAGVVPRHRAAWDSELSGHDRFLQNQRDARRWEFRMKAVGERLRAGSAAPAPSAPPRVPVAEPHRRPPRYETVARRAEVVVPPPAARTPGPVRDAVAAPPWREPAAPRPVAPRIPASRLEPVRPAPAPEPKESNADLVQPPSFAESDDFARQVDALSTVPDTPVAFPLATETVPPADPCPENEPQEPEASSIPAAEGLAPILDDPADAPPPVIETGRVSVPEVGTEGEPDPAEVEPTPSSWTDPAPFLTRTFLGEPDPAEEGPPPIVHETSTFEERRGYSRSEPGLSAEPLPSREWPSVADILAAQGVRPGPAPSAGPRKRKSPGPSRPVPTEVREPAAWSLPLWLGWPPVAAAALALGGAGLVAGWSWSRDGYNAGVVAARLADPSARPGALPEGVSPAGAGWWRTDAPNLVAWAALAGLGRDGSRDRSGRVEAARELLNRAAAASPLNPAARHALAQKGAGGDEPVPLAAVLRQSRDVLPMAAAGRRLLSEGKKAEALEAYRVALSMAARPDPARAEAPPFLEEPDAMRYGLPGEDLLGPLVAEMAASPDWTYAEWSPALPDSTLARVVAARVLKASGGQAATAALAAVTAEPGPDGPPGPLGDETPAEAAVRVAAGAEALALRGRWADARDEYRRAIALTPVDVVRRAWWLNVAAFSLRLNEEPDRLKALEAAKNTDPNDAVTLRVVEIQKQMGYVARQSGAADGGPIGREATTPGPAPK